MSFRTVGYLVVDNDDNQGTCSECGAEDVVMPFGEDGKPICYTCAYSEKNEPRTSKNMLKFLKKATVITGKEKAN